MILTLGNSKGGVGKSTLAIQVALARALAGRDVLLVDGDRQGSAQTAIAYRTQGARAPGLACVQITEGSMLRDQVRRQAGKYQDVIIDTGAKDTAALRAALFVTDVLLVPFPPRSIDVWVLAEFGQLVEEARSVRDGLRALAVLNRADPGVSADNRDAAAAISEFPQFRLLETSIGDRKAFANATGLGLSVEELRPRDRKACDELASLIRNAFAFADNMHTMEDAR
jgi:chromosome partitioning protein